MRGTCYSIVPILTLDGIITYDIVEGSVTSDRFIQFLHDYSPLPLTNPFPGPQGVLILDNCQIHHSEDIQRLVEDKACNYEISCPISRVLIIVKYVDFFHINKHLYFTWLRCKDFFAMSTKSPALSTSIASLRLQKV
ncbi:hypothetical protein BS17DRAFT_750166 [Gyrodon lividus]|nr:hypothetical protein BS17DRAFT_750166 [Gyrodon lividus]